MSGPRLISRDYKRPRRGQFGLDIGRWRDFGLGLIVGLVAAGVVYVADHRASDVSGADQPVPRRSATAASVTAPRASADASPEAAAAADPAVQPEGSYDFYHMLPKFEVVVPEKEHGSRPAPTAQIDRPGIYFLQAGSYRDPAVAERVRGQLAKLGIDASVQRVAVDADVWHRVRIGPIRELPKLNHLRSLLQQSSLNLDPLVVRVDD
ncbi:MAG TPA: SPOR domain-containing protein [Steroidobacteraceae bacterium]